MKNDLKKKFLKNLSVILTLFVVVTFFGGCGNAKDTGNAGSNTEKETSSSGQETDEASPVLPANAKTLEPKEKKESVHVKADPYGSPLEITVSETLSGMDENTFIHDVSSLSSIKNKDGDEEFYIQDNGDIIWENHGKDITYEGTADKELPFQVTLTYSMDGEEMTAEEIAGKKGEFKIRIDYKNITAKSDDFIPFAALTFMTFDEEAFHHIKVKNGRVTKIGEMYAAVGFGLPGIKKELKLSGFEPTEDIKLPSYVIISGETDGFELDFSATIVTNGLFSDIKKSDIKDLKDMKKDMKKLRKASKKLADGAGKLEDGAEDFEDYLTKYTDGAGELVDGAEKLEDGLETLDENGKALDDGAAQLKEGLKELNDSLSQVEDPSFAALKEAVKKLYEGSSGLSEGINAYTDGVHAAKEGAAGIYKGAESYSQAGEKLSKGYASLLKGIRSLAEGSKKFDEKGIAELTDVFGSDFGEVIDALSGLKKSDRAYKSYTGDLGEAEDGEVRFLIETEEIKP